MFDRITGQLFFKEGLIVGPTLTPEAITSYIDQEKDKVVENGNWKTYTIRNITIYGYSVSLLTVFKMDQIESLRLSCVSNRNSWASYSPAEEIVVKKKTERLLKKILGTQLSGQFPWGSVESLYDIKTGDAGIFIRYRE